MDVIYTLKDYPTKFRDLELCYSLRSLRYYEHDKVWIVTDRKRNWLKNVKWIKQEDGHNRWENGRKKVEAACNCPDVSDPFLYMMDDVFFTEPVEEIPHYYDGTIKERMRGGTYGQMLKENIKRSADGLNYELHVPLVVYKDEWLQYTGPGMLPRSPYCSHSKHPKAEMEDVKLYSRKDHNNAAMVIQQNPFVSLSEYSLLWISDLLEDLYGEPCEYEV